MKDFSHAATILGVMDLSLCQQFYVDQLGFDIYFKWGNPVHYMVLKKEGITLNLTLVDDLIQVPDHSVLFIFCNDVKALYQKFLQKGIGFEEPLQDTDYGMRTFVLKDPNGYKITFGTSQSL